MTPERSRELHRQAYWRMKNDPERYAAYKKNRAKWYATRPATYKKKIAAQAMKWYHENYERARAARRRYYLAHRARLLKRAKHDWRLREYGLSRKDYAALWKKQNRRCAICGRKRARRSMHVDHCHESNKVRGILCQACNHGIGFLPTVEVLQGAITYLQRQ